MVHRVRIYSLTFSKGRMEETLVHEFESRATRDEALREAKLWPLEGPKHIWIE